MKFKHAGSDVVDQSYHPKDLHGVEKSKKDGGSNKNPGKTSRGISEFAHRTKDFLWGSRRRKIVTGIGVAVWSLLSYEKPLHIEILPSPTETADAVLRATGSALTYIFDDTLLGGDSSESSTADTTPTSVASGSVDTVVVNVDSQTPETTTGGNLEPVTTVNLAPTTTQLAITSTTLGLESLLPNPMQYSVAAGSVVCTGEVMMITQDPSSGVAPLTQIREQVLAQTGQNLPFDQGDPTMDNQFYNEISDYGKLLVYPLRPNCTGLDN
jgi:hypothetical protein